MAFNFRLSSSTLSLLLYVLLVITAFISYPNFSMAVTQVTFAWDANSEPDLAGYRLYSRPANQVYNYSLPDCDTLDTSCTVYNLEDTVEYCFIVRAYDTNENESSDSNEVCQASSYDVDDDGDGVSENQGDCNDVDPSVNPGATEECGDGIDQDCNGSDLICGDDIDDDYDGYTENQSDCDDSDATIHPGASEICGDGIDQDCNGTDLICGDDIDDDYDGYTENQGDCDDSDATIHPGASEICGDGIDQDCNGSDLTCEEDFTLTVNAYKIKGDKYANLNWSGANSTYIDVYRNDSMIDTIANDGEYIHGPFRAGKPATYRVCEAVTSTCSNEITVGW